MQAFRIGDPVFAVNGACAGGQNPLRVMASIAERRPHAGLLAKARRAVCACALKAGRHVLGRLRGTLKIFDNLNNLT